MNRTHYLTWTRGAIAAGFLGIALAQTPAFAQHGRHAQYLTGGVTKEEADELRQQAAGFPLEVQFARRTQEGNAFAADVAVRIVDAGGRTVLEVPAAQPILLANVAPGRYTIEATFDGQMKRQAVTVGRGHAQASFLW
jgi:hypothetical protein